MDIKILYTSLVLAMLTCACKSNGTEKPVENVSQQEEPKIELVKTPNFNEDSSFLCLKRQVSFGKRIPNTKAHDHCRQYFVDYFKKKKWEVVEQKFVADAFDKTPLKLTNIVASLNPKATKRIILAAHWDSRPFADQDPDIKKQKSPIDGANDGGSGVAVLMELARAIATSDVKPEIGIDLILFDGEDYGAPSFANYEGNSSLTWCLGSQHWAKTKHIPNYQAYYGVLLDMVGGRNVKFYKDLTSAKYAPVIQNQVWDIASAMGYGQVFENKYSEEIIDDHLFVNEVARIPMVDIIEYEPSDGAYFSPTWHTHEDNIENIDKNSLKTVGQLLLQLVYKEKQTGA